MSRLTFIFALPNIFITATPSYCSWSKSCQNQEMTTVTEESNDKIAQVLRASNLVPRLPFGAGRLSCVKKGSGYEICQAYFLMRVLRRMRNHKQVYVYLMWSLLFLYTGNLISNSFRFPHNYIFIPEKQARPFPWPRPWTWPTLQTRQLHLLIWCQTLHSWT